MSLIVAILRDGHISIVSDTKLLSQYEVVHNVRRTVIKASLVSPKVCIAFAGNLEYADEALRRVKARGSEAQYADILLSCHLSSDLATDFILAFAGPKPAIWQIKDGRRIRTNSAWIGSLGAFNRYQRARHSSISGDTSHVAFTGFSFLQLPEGYSDEARQVFVSMVKAMKVVVDDEECAEVGGVVVPISLHNGSLSYMRHGSFLRIPLTDVELAAGTNTVHMGSAETGAYAVSFNGGSSSDVCIYYKHGRFGVLYTDPEGGFPKPFVLSGIDQVTFQEYLAGSSDCSLEVTLGSLSLEYADRALKYLQIDEPWDSLEWINVAIRYESKNWRAQDDAKISVDSLESYLRDRGVLQMSAEVAERTVYLLLIKAEVMARLGSYWRAVKCYQEVLTIDISNAAALYNLAVNSLRLRRYSFAISVLNQLVDVNPEQPDAYAMRGYALLRDLQVDDAILDFEIALHRFNESRESYIENIETKLSSWMGTAELIKRILGKSSIGPRGF